MFICLMRGVTMTEVEKLEILLKEVKEKIQRLDAIEARLINMRELATKSMDTEVLKEERLEIQEKIENLIIEIELLDKDKTMKQ